MGYIWLYNGCNTGQYGVIFPFDKKSLLYVFTSTLLRLRISTAHVADVACHAAASSTEGATGSDKGPLGKGSKGLRVGWFGRMNLCESSE